MERLDNIQTLVTWKPSKGLIHIVHAVILCKPIAYLGASTTDGVGLSHGQQSYLA
jgi:hypothetical protein